MEGQNTGAGPSPSLNLTADLNTPRKLADFAAKADSIGMGGVKDADAVNNAGAAAWALGGSNRDVVANRAAIRMANLSAAETLKAELTAILNTSIVAESKIRQTNILTGWPNAQE